MEARVDKGKAAAAMRSPINWSLLGLVIQRPSYGYELVQRFERAYGGALDLSSPSQIYAALDVLERRGLVELLPVDTSENSRQPKPHYRVTPIGQSAYVDWLVSHVQSEQRRSLLFVHQIAVLSPEDALDVIERCERECLKAATASAAKRAGEDGANGHVIDRLADEETRLAIDARLAWIEYARRHLRSLATVHSTPNEAAAKR